MGLQGFSEDNAIHRDAEDFRKRDKPICPAPESHTLRFTCIPFIYSHNDTFYHTRIMEVWFSMAATAYMIKSFGVLSVAKFSAILGLIWGFVLGLVFLLFGSIASMIGAQSLGMGAGIAGFIMMIIFGGIGGFIGGAIMAVIYNIILGVIGGIEMDLEPKA